VILSIRQLTPAEVAAAPRAPEFIPRG
jgi:hypothetical protein